MSFFSKFLDWHLDDNHDGGIVGFNSCTRIDLVDGEMLLDAMVEAYLIGGVVLERIEFDKSGGGKKLGREFIPYWRIKSIYEAAD